MLRFCGGCIVILSLGTNLQSLIFEIGNVEVLWTKIGAVEQFEISVDPCVEGLDCAEDLWELDKRLEFSDDPCNKGFEEDLEWCADDSCDCNEASECADDTWELEER